MAEPQLSPEARLLILFEVRKLMMAGGGILVALLGFLGFQFSESIKARSDELTKAQVEKHLTDHKAEIEGDRAIAKEVVKAALNDARDMAKELGSGRANAMVTIEDLKRRAAEAQVSIGEAEEVANKARKEALELRGTWESFKALVGEKAPELKEAIDRYEMKMESLQAEKRPAWDQRMLTFKMNGKSTQTVSIPLLRAPKNGGAVPCIVEMNKFIVTTTNVSHTSGQTAIYNVESEPLRPATQGPNNHAYGWAVTVNLPAPAPMADEHTVWVKISFVGFGPEMDGVQFGEPATSEDVRKLAQSAVERFINRK